MLLERIDIDAHGPLNRVELGPFSEHLNVVFGPEGSGKTAIARFVRDSILDREYPLGMMSSSSGRVVWADRNGLLHCRREQDGSKQGRRSIEFESRGGSSYDSYLHDHPWLGSVVDGGPQHPASLHGVESAATRAVHSIQLPEAIIDAVITDTAITQVARVVSACIRCGLDSPQTYRSLPFQNAHLDHPTAAAGYDRFDAPPMPANDRQARSLRAQLADVELELSRLEPTPLQEESLLARRDELTQQLNRRSTRTATAAPRHDREHIERRLADMHDRATHLRARQNELRRWVADLDSQLHANNVNPTDSVTDNYKQHWAMRDETLRRQLDDLDAQMIRWRRALLEVRGLRDAILATRQHLRSTGHAYATDFGPRDEAILRRRRLDGFLDAIDRFDPSRGWNEFYSDAYYADDLHHASRVRSEADVRYSRSGRAIDPIHSLDELDQRVESATRQIDWLLQRYASNEHVDHQWYQQAGESSAFGGTTLEETLRTIRNDLVHASRHAVNQKWDSLHGHAVPSATLSPATADDLRELDRSEKWLVNAIDQMMQHREWMLNRYTPSEMKETQDWARHRELLQWRYQNERAERVAELDRTSRELESCLADVARLRRHAQESIAADAARQAERQDAIAREAIVQELRILDSKLARLSRVRWLRSRAKELRDQLRAMRTPVQTASPLAQTASRWLVRLSGGRLRSVSWQTERISQPLLNDPVAPPSQSAATVHDITRVFIDGRDESRCSNTQRALTVIAVRMAAGELLARLGKPVPVVLEIPRSLPAYVNHSIDGDRPAATADTSFYHHSHDGRLNHPIAAALRDYAGAGRQIVLLTSDQNLTDELARVGGRCFALRADRVVHAHRPLWKPHYATEQYIGPHPHTYGDHLVGEHPSYQTDDYRVNDINRDLDMAWRETYGASVNAEAAAPSHHRAANQFYGSHPVRTDAARDGAMFRDGYYYADTYTTSAPHSIDATVVPRRNSVPQDRIVTDRGQLNVMRHGESSDPAFFLTVDSPIDQAPSIDAVAAARLRGLMVTHITHLMQQDPNRLSDALGLASVDASTIRRWQSECRLVCRVPKLRGFDARVLVGCGVTDPAQLASIHPTDLLQRVEDFLATEQGQKVLLSGSSRELSRITSWIAAANSWGPEKGPRYVDGRAIRKTNRQSRRTSDRSQFSDHQGLGYDDLDDAEVRYGIVTINGYRRDHDGLRVARDRSARSDSARSDSARSDSTRSSSARSSSRRSSSMRSGTTRSLRRGRTTESNRRRYSESNDDRSSRLAGLSARSGNRETRQADSNEESNYRDSRNRDGYNSDQTTHGESSQSSRGERSRRRRSNRDGSTSKRDVVRLSDREAQPESRSFDRSDREPRESRELRESHERRESRSMRDRSETRAVKSREPRDTESELRFYLQRDSPVVDAPSIGPRMADRLSKIGIHTVDDLLNADPDRVADKLGNRRIDGDIVLAWQQQATLVCRIPMLRGHDAQLLVAAEITSPEELADQEVEELFGRVDPISRSREGKRIIRGGKLPDKEEVGEWIRNAKVNRELLVA
ncbi:DUF4332 domain-containing protein [Novipirellula caenicola]|uniref:DUF4332 domain-containing protein n=1 Tax=Novipirellula caenicola TaxID=1536901 RepID=A0ABP9VLG7_9BACT